MNISLKNILITILLVTHIKVYGMATVIDLIREGDSYLNEKYLYRDAIHSFLKANNLLQDQENGDHLQKNYFQGQVWNGLAMSYHNIGNAVERDAYMLKVQHLLHIPHETVDYNDSSIFTENAVGYFVLKGYRFYIYFEQAHLIDAKEHALLSAREAFLKASEIADTLNLNTEFYSHAFQGLGTSFEFLSKCALENGNNVQAKEYALQSTDAFIKALRIRVQLLGQEHIHVARSYHKLARSYVHTSSFQDAVVYLKLADEYYKKAIDIFEKNQILSNHAKYKELLDDYAYFKGLMK